ncbi:MAG: thioesterase family protein [Staphylococcus epidermidis]|nr:thioesterase family protein [Staphylococcus epidermidis]
MMNQQYVFHTKVHRDWVGHNGHLNDAMYNRIFSDTTDDWLGHLGLTIDAIQSYQYTVFTLENHVMFLNEMKENEDVIVKVHLHDFDSKRLHVLMEMFNADDDLCATYEVMLMGIDTTSGRPSAFPNDILNNIERYYNIENVETTSQYIGHRIGIKKKPKRKE